MVVKKLPNHGIVCNIFYCKFFFKNNFKDLTRFWKLAMRQFQEKLFMVLNKTTNSSNYSRVNKLKRVRLSVLFLLQSQLKTLYLSLSLSLLFIIYFYTYQFPQLLFKYVQCTHLYNWLFRQRPQRGDVLRSSEFTKHIL